MSKPSPYIGYSYDTLENEHLHLLWSAVRLFLDGTPPDMVHLQLHAMILDTATKLKKLSETVQELGKNDN